MYGTLESVCQQNGISIIATVKEVYSSSPKGMNFQLKKMTFKENRFANKNSDGIFTISFQCFFRGVNMFNCLETLSMIE